MAGRDLEHQGDVPDTSRGVPAGLIAGGVIGVALAAFVVQNTEKVAVEWLFLDMRQPLWLLLLITVAAALVLGELVGAALRRRKRKAK